MAPTSWSTPRDVALRWREWDGDFVVFNPASGDTHFLNAVAAVVLKRLESQPGTVDEIVAYLAKFSEAPLAPGLSENIEALVARLDAVGLVAPVAR